MTRIKSSQSKPDTSFFYSENKYGGMLFNEWCDVKKRRVVSYYLI